MFSVFEQFSVYFSVHLIDYADGVSLAYKLNPFCQGAEKQTKGNLSFSILCERLLLKIYFCI